MMRTGARTGRLFGIGLLAVACSKGPAVANRAGEQPDERPTMINTDPPFHYPVALYARKAQGNVTLRLYVDSNGKPVADSTNVEQSSGFAGFDSAAVAGAAELRFIPAKLR